MSSLLQPAPVELADGRQAVYIPVETFVERFGEINAAAPDAPISMAPIFNWAMGQAHPFADKDKEMDVVVPELAAPLVAPLPSEPESHPSEDMLAVRESEPDLPDGPEGEDPFGEVADPENDPDDLAV